MKLGAFFFMGTDFHTLLFDARTAPLEHQVFRAITHLNLKFLTFTGRRNALEECSKQADFALDRVR